MSAASPPAVASAERLSSEQLRVSMSRVITGWAFGAVFFQLSAGAVYASFARQLGASESEFGFLAGVYPLMGFLQIPAARLIERNVGWRKLMLWSGLISRSLWVLAASLPLFNLVWPDLLGLRAMLNIFIGCLLLSSVGQAMTGPPFFSWMSSLVPGRLGPAFWAKRHQVGTVAGIFAVLFGGYVADHAGQIKDWSNGEFPPLLTYSALLSLAAVCGVMDIALFIGVKEPPRELRRDKLPPLWQSLVAPLRERPVRRFLTFTVVHVIGLATTGPLLWLYCLERLDFDKTRTGLLLTVAPLLGMAISSRWWGGIAKIHGTRPMLRFASMGLVIVPIAWLLALPTSTFGLALMLFASGVLMAAYEISNMNFITRVCPHLPRPTMAALFSICAGTTFALASWGAGTAAEWLDGFHAEFVGLEFSNYHLIFAFSLLPRAFNAFVLAPRLDEENATATRETVNEVGQSLAEAIAPRFSRFFEAREE